MVCAEVIPSSGPHLPTTRISIELAHARIETHGASNAVTLGIVLEDLAR
jgi:hypothetical protein